MEYLKWTVQHDLSILLNWFKANQLSMNGNKSVGMLFSRNQKLSVKEQSVENVTIKFVSHTKFLRLWIDKDLTWNEHTSWVNQNICQNLHLLKSRKNFLYIHSKRLLYFAQIQSHLIYGLLLWDNMLSATMLNKLQKAQNKCVSLINGKRADLNNYKKLSILRIKELLELENCKFGYKLLHHELPIRIEELLNHDQFGHSLQKTHRYNTRNHLLLNKPLTKNKHYKNCIISKGTGALETLKVETKLKPNLLSFTKDCKKQILDALN